MTIRSLGRVDLMIGEALRLEMTNPEAGGEDVVNVQYYISTESGGWALWVSCPRDDLAGLEATVHDSSPPVSERP